MIPHDTYMLLITLLMMAQIVVILFSVILVIPKEAWLTKDKRVSALSEKVSGRAWVFAIVVVAICLVTRFVIELLVGTYNDECTLWGTAVSILNTGHDLQGVELPIMSTPWEVGGQTNLYVYLVQPILRIFGTSLVIFRLPNLILWLGTLSWAVLHLRKYYSDRAAWYILLIVGTSMWFQWYSAVVLDATLLMPLITMGIILVDLGIRTNRVRYYYLSMIMFGISYWSYALACIVTTTLVASYGIYLLISKRVAFMHAVGCILVMLVVAYPAVAGWLYTLTGIELPNIFNYPRIDYFEREKSLGIATANIGHQLEYWFGKVITYYSPLLSVTSVTGCVPEWLGFGTTAGALVIVSCLIRRCMPKKVLFFCVPFGILAVVLELTVFSGCFFRFTLTYIACILLLGTALALMSKVYRRFALVMILTLHIGATSVGYISYLTDTDGICVATTYRMSDLPSAIRVLRDEYDVEHPVIITEQWISQSCNCWMYEDDFEYVVKVMDYLNGTPYEHVYNSHIYDDDRSDFIHHYSDINMKQLLGDEYPVTAEYASCNTIPEGYSIVMNLLIPDDVAVVSRYDNYSIVYSDSEVPVRIWINDSPDLRQVTGIGEEPPYGNVISGLSGLR